MRRIEFALVLLAGALFATGATAQAPQLYWGGADQNVYRTNLDGSGQETVVDVEASIQGLELDATGTKLYWSSSGDGDVGRANAGNGGALEVIGGGNTGNDRGLVIDSTAGVVYYTQPSISPRIAKVDIDGGNPLNLVLAGDASPLVVPWGIDLRLAISKMYWTEAGGSFRIRRADLDGMNVEDIHFTTGSPRGFAIDEPAGRMYWGEQTPNRIVHANFDGSSETAIVTGLPSAPIDVELDVTDGKIYWLVGSAIQRADLDGSNVETIIATATGGPAAIAIRRIPSSLLPGLSPLALGLLLVLLGGLGGVALRHQS